MRLVAIAAALEGARRAEAAKAGAMDRHTLREGVIRLDALGLRGWWTRGRATIPAALMTGSARS